MNILEKIAEINKEPLHVRMRWVWGCVTASMLLILIIWGFAISSLFKENTAATEEEAGQPSINEQIKNIKNQAPSISDYAPKENSASINNISQEGVSSTTNNTDFPYPAATSEPSEINSAAYNKQ